MLRLVGVLTKHLLWVQNTNQTDVLVFFSQSEVILQLRSTFTPVHWSTVVSGMAITADCVLWARLAATLLFLSP